MRLMSLDGGVSATVADRLPASAETTPAGGLIARGAGLSYAAASFGPSVVVLEARDRRRVLDFDTVTGVVEVEAGITLGELHDALAPRGHFLPTQPGYSGITVGGCIAADVHGKNPARDGTFVRQVESLTLFHPDHGTITLSRNQAPEVFALTCGGFGLTGVIRTARLRTRKLPGAWVEARTYATADANGTAAVLRLQAMDSDFAYAWLNLLDTGPGFGRGFVTALAFAGDASVPGAADHRYPPPRLTAEGRARLPVSLMYAPTIRAMNLVYTLMARRRRSGERQSLGRALFTFNGNELYHELFGRPGFHESQVIVPHDAFPAFMEAIRTHSRRLGAPISLGAGKLFAGTAEGLRFDGDGICIAVNLRRGRAAAAFLAALDQDMVRLGGRPNLIKDSRLPRAVFDATVPDADRVRHALRAWDPRRRFRSELSERLGL